LIAYTFLSTGAVEPMSGFAWPEQGAWVEAKTAPSEALRGYPAGDLPYWFDDELWNVELAGAMTERAHVLLAERARLLGRIDSWSEPLAWEFVTACAQRVVNEAAAALRDDRRAGDAEQLEAAGDLADLERSASVAAAHAGRAGTLAGYLADVCFYARTAAVGAHAAGVAAKMSSHALASDAAGERRRDEVLTAERTWQANWLVDQLGLRG
jgi:hypothetical protein